MKLAEVDNFSDGFLTISGENSLETSEKKIENVKKVFRPVFRCLQHPKAGQNTQQSLLIFMY